MRNVDEPIARTSTWEAGKQYYQGRKGEPYVDIVSRYGTWYRCQVTHVSKGGNSDNGPVEGSSSTNWDRSNKFGFVATDLLLADQAVIKLMFSQKILMTNSKNQLTASVNADENGAYCIYYPETGRKMMEFSSKGYIFYYNNDDGNTLAWRLGHGGDITQGGSDDWKPVWLCPVGTGQSVPTPAFTSESTFELIERWQFISGSDGTYSAHNNEIFTGKPTNNNPDAPQPSDITLIENGWYTEMAAPFGKIDDSGDEMLWYIVVERIDNGIVGSKHLVIRKADGTFVTTETY
jgi:hypothetical protein